MSALIVCAVSGNLCIFKQIHHFIKSPDMTLTNILGCPLLFAAILGTVLGDGDNYAQFTRSHRKKCLEMMKFLLILEPQQINFVSNGSFALSTAIECAARGGTTEAIDTLLEFKELDINLRGKDGKTALHCVVIDELPLRVLKQLLSHRFIDINTQSDDGTTALMYATETAVRSSCRRMSVLDTILESNNVDVNMQTNTGQTALHVAISSALSDQCVVDVIERLLNHKNIDVNIKNADGHTAFTLALAKRTHELLRITELFLENKDIDLGVAEAHGNTPLHYYATLKDTQVLRLIVSRSSSNIDQRNSSGETPIFLAAKCCIEQAVVLLLERGMMAGIRSVFIFSLV